MLSWPRTLHSTGVLLRANTRSLRTSIGGGSLTGEAAAGPLAPNRDSAAVDGHDRSGHMTGARRAGEDARSTLWASTSTRLALFSFRQRECHERRGLLCMAR